MVWSQYRRIDAGEVTFEDLDMEIEVNLSDEGEPTFDATIWNLTPETWEQVSKGDECRITLGWDDGPTENVIFGVIEKKTKNRDTNDIGFRLKGVDKSEQQVKQRLSNSWETGTKPTVVAKDIAGAIGLTAGDVDSISGTMAQTFLATQDKPARHWLNELVSEAENLTGTAWQWFVDSGKLYFVEKDGRSEEAVVLSYDNTLISIGEAESQGTEDSSGLKFEAMCEPRIRKGGAVVVETDKFNGPYKVTDYTFKSNSTNGDHTVSGRLSPLDVEYTVQTNRYDYSV